MRSEQVELVLAVGVLALVVGVLVLVAGVEQVEQAEQDC